MGQVTWQRTYGGYSMDEGATVLATQDEGYLVVGSTGSFGMGNSDIYVLKLDADGQKTWSRTLGTAGLDQGVGAVEVDGGGYVVVGFTNGRGQGGYDGYVAMLDDDGTPLWERTYGGPDWDFLYSVCRDPDGGFLLAGQTFSGGEGDGDAWLIKLNEEGTSEWERTYGGPGRDMARSVIPTADGGFMLAGGNTVNDDQDAWLVKVGASGDLEWDVRVGGDSLDYANSVIQTMDGGYVAVGSTRSYNEFVEALHFKVSSTGQSQWLRNWGQVNNQESYQVLETADGQLVSVGYVNTSGSGGKDMFILFTDGNGDFIVGVSNGGDNGTADECGFSLDATSDGGFIFCGYTDSFGYGSRDVYVVKTDSTGWTATSEVISEFDPLSVPGVQERDLPLLYPNPAHGLVQISTDRAWESILLYDGSGHLVGRYPGRTTAIALGDLAEGEYWLRMIDHGGMVFTHPLILIRP